MSVEWRAPMTPESTAAERGEIEKVACEMYGYAPPAMDRAQLMVRLFCRVLEDVSYELTTLHGLWATDDMYLFAEHRWQIDTSELRSRIDGILADVAKVEKEAW